MVSTKKIIAVIIIAVVAIAGFYGAFTFPKTAIDFNVIFTVGADRKLGEFDVPLLHDKVQVIVNIENGSALWNARITNSNGTEIWSHGAAQGGQITYQSGWLSVPTGRNNFTFGTIGLGEMEANIRVDSKGGFW